jgi:hypothetical protein
MDTTIYFCPVRVQVVRDYQDGRTPNHGRAQPKFVTSMKGNTDERVPEIMDIPSDFCPVRVQVVRD